MFIASAMIIDHNDAFHKISCMNNEHVVHESMNAGLKKKNQLVPAQRVP